MNERIKELADATAKLMPSGVYNTEYESGKKGVEFTEDALEKFAELIVQECCDWIDGSPSTDAGQLVLTKSFIIANLKGHFGVEE